MSEVSATPLCRIHQHLNETEAGRIKRLLGRVRWGLLPVERPAPDADDAVLRHCPYMKEAGPSQLCARHCHLHHLVFAESWP